MYFYFSPSSSWHFFSLSSIFHISLHLYNSFKSSGRILQSSSSHIHCLLVTPHTACTWHLLRKLVCHPEGRREWLGREMKTLLPWPSPSVCKFLGAGVSDEWVNECWHSTTFRTAHPQQVTLYRQYRVGELPDIQIPHRAVIAPLQALSQVCTCYVEYLCPG